MKIEDHVCSPEQAEKLMNLIGHALETQFYWLYNDAERARDPILLSRDHVDDDMKTGHSFDCWLFPAPTVAELGVLLGKYFNWLRLRIDDDSEDIGKYISRLQQPGLVHVASKMDHWINYEKTEANSKAYVLIWLIENDFLKVDGLKL